MATVETLYLGGMRTEATHVRSGQKITTDAPVDNQGKGEFFSPTDMVAAALGSCMLTIMDQAAACRDMDITGTQVSITKVMAADPRRISEIIVEFRIPGSFSDKQKAILEKAAHTCPVAQSLHPDMKQTVTFHYGE